tara:strand:+ start:150 stop:1217 length:1068 start_codon:yes stop_codon:yes gene_type:complete
MPLSQQGLGGGAASLFRSSVGGLANPFTLTLESTNNSRNGDTTSVQNTWWANQTYDATFVTNIGQQSYQGFYAFTAGQDATLTATLGGAAGWRNVRGRSITASFSIFTGDRIVFFAGKPTQPIGSEGAGGGASCLMKYDTSLSSDADYANGFVPLIIAAGGGEGGTSTQYELSSAAPPLTTTTNNTSSQIMTVRNNLYSNANLVAKEGGAGRDNTAQQGGCGWKGPSRIEDSAGGTGNATSGSVGLAYGATGNSATSGSNGGFGGGGAGKSGNFYGAGAGGYYGGCEGTGASANSTVYEAYGINGGNVQDHKLGALSFVHSSGFSVTDNGLYGTSSLNTTVASQQIYGKVQLSFA